MANSPVLTSLPDYVEQRRLPLIKEAVLKFIDWVNSVSLTIIDRLCL